MNVGEFLLERVHDEGLSENALLVAIEEAALGCLISFDCVVKHGQQTKEANRAMKIILGFLNNVFSPVPSAWALTAAAAPITA